MWSIYKDTRIMLLRLGFQVRIKPLSARALVRSYHSVDCAVCALSLSSYNRQRAGALSSLARLCSGALPSLALGRSYYLPPRASLQRKSCSVLALPFTQFLFGSFSNSYQVSTLLFHLKNPTFAHPSLSNSFFMEFFSPISRKNIYMRFFGFSSSFSPSKRIFFRKSFQISIALFKDFNPFFWKAEKVE